MIQLPSTLSRTLGLEPAGPAEDGEAGLGAPGAPDGAEAPGRPRFDWGDPSARLRELHDMHRAVQAFAYHAPGGGGGGAPPAPPSTVMQADVLKAMKGGFVDVKNLGDPLKKALADAGTDASALARLAVSR